MGPKKKTDSENKRRLKQLAHFIAKDGMMKVATDLGYRSQTTINNWIRNNEIPSVAISKVDNYLSTKGVLL